MSIITVAGAILTAYVVVAMNEARVDLNKIIEKVRREFTEGENAES